MASVLGSPIPKTRSTLNPDIDFPAEDVNNWFYLGHLPTFCEVIGAIRGLVTKKCSGEKATGHVAKALIDHWCARNVYPKSYEAVHQNLLAQYKEFMAVKKLIIRPDRKATQESLDRYAVLQGGKNKIYDIFGDSSEELNKTNVERCKQRVKRYENEYGVRMTKNEYDYLDSQRSDIPRSKKLQCFPRNNDVDPAWIKQQERNEKNAYYEESQRNETSDMFNTAMLCDSTDTEEENDMLVDDEGNNGEASSFSKRRKYKHIPEKADDPLPYEMRHVRTSERCVRDEIYLATTDLIGIGLSPREALSAVEIVANRCFGRGFHQLRAPMEKEEIGAIPINQDTLPGERSVRDMAERVEAEGLAAEAKEIITRSKEGDTITHAGDSTTKKYVGKFYVSGIHVNKESALPLPTVPVAGEARDEIAEQAALGFQILAAACNPPIDPSELYKETDLHLTDSVAHNKFLKEDVPKLFNLDHKVGQIFCSTHTGLGFCSSMNTSIHQIEQKQGIANIMDGFIVEIEYESKNGSLVGQFVDCMTRLVGMELKHKPWNRGEDFKKYCGEHGKLYTMFLYKDERFGCFPKACAVCLYSREILQEFLMSHPDIDNRLACLVRDIYGHEYLKLVMAVVAVFGIQLIEPFHARTISKDSNHNTLKIFFKNLHDHMSVRITSTFFDMDNPWYPGISKRLFEAVKDGYGKEVTESLINDLRKYTEEAVRLANFMQPGLQTTLARQRRDYGLSDEFVPEHPIDELSEKVRENAPTHNLGMESSCGLVGHRTKKNLNLEATSRSIMINGTKALREKYGSSFRDFSQAVRRVKNIKLAWKKKQESVSDQKMDIKQANNLKIEGRTLQQLAKLKEVDGPFTDVLSIDEYLQDEKVSMKEKQQRMKTEIQYARDTSTSVPRTNPVFRIRTQKTVGKKSKDLSALEFGTNLKTLITKKSAAAGKVITVQDFIKTLDGM